MRYDAPGFRGLLALTDGREQSNLLADLVQSQRLGQTAHGLND